MQLFKRTKQLENEIQLFLDNIIQCGFAFQEAFRCYFKQEDPTLFPTLQDKIDVLEQANDTLRRKVENQLYAHTLLPDIRSDILRLIEGCDKIINKYQTDINLLSIEKPAVPQQLQQPILDLIQTDLSCVQKLVLGIQAVFAGRRGNDLIQEVYLLEHQADLQAMALKEMVFQKLHLTLARQIQLKEFIYGIEKISDMAEDMADLLSVFMVKHSV